MRIAFIVDSFPKLSETFILNQITGLLDMGHDVQIFPTWHTAETKVHPDVTKYDLLARTHPIPPTPASKLKRLMTAVIIFLQGFAVHPVRTFRLLRLLLADSSSFSLRTLYFLNRFRNGFDVVHCHYGTNGLIALHLQHMGVLSDTPFIITFHGYDLNCISTAEASLKYRHLFASVELVTANSQFSTRRLISIGCDPAKIVTLPMGISLERIRFKHRTVAPDTPVRLLTVGRLTEVKGYEYSLAAFACVAAGRNVTYDIVGDGPLLGDLRDLAQRLKIASRVNFLGALTQDEVLHAYETADIFVLTGIRASSGEEETQGLVLQEAQASGLPVLASRCGGMAEGMRDGRTGILVPEKDLNAIVEGLEFLIDNPQKRLEFGIEGRKWVESRYDIRKLNAMLEGQYKILMHC